MLVGVGVVDLGDGVDDVVVVVVTVLCTAATLFPVLLDNEGIKGTWVAAVSRGKMLGRSEFFPNSSTALLYRSSAAFMKAGLRMSV